MNNRVYWNIQCLKKRPTFGLL